MVDTKLSALATVTPLATDLVYLVRGSLGTAGSKGAPVSALSTLIKATNHPDITDVAGVSVTVGVPTTIGAHVAFGAGSVVDDPNSTLFGTFPTVLNINSEFTGTLTRIAASTRSLTANHSAASGVDKTIIGDAIGVYTTSSVNFGNLYGQTVNVYHGGTATALNVYGIQYDVELFGGSGVVGNVYGTDILIRLETVATSAYGHHLNIAATGAGGASSVYGFYCDEIAGTITNAYYFWADSRGVYRIREDNAVDPGNAQAVTALYNPRFAKYTAGAVDYERIVQQWNTNVAEFGVEVGGTGVLRPLKLLGASVSLSSDDAYGAGWNGSLQIPTKNAIYDKIESLGSGGVTSITGTANQVIRDVATGAVTLSLPQSIGTASAVTFGGLTLNGTYLQTSASATAFTVGPNGATNPTLLVHTSTASAITGLQITAFASAGGVSLTAIGGTNEDIRLVPKGGGFVRIGGPYVLPISGNLIYGFDASAAGYINGQNLDWFNGNPTRIQSYSALTIKTTDTGGITFTPAATFNSTFSIGNVLISAGYLQMTEMTAPAAPATNSFRLFAQDNGAGKTQFMIQFATGVAQEIKIEA